MNKPLLDGFSKNALTRHRALVMIGKPGAGKGTQGRILGAAPGLVYLAAGDLLRALAESSSELGTQVRQTIRDGDLLPDDLVLSLLENHIDDLEASGAYDSHSDLLILDGIPRTLEQADRLDRIVEVMLVIHLRCDDNEALFRRIRRRAELENRRDDREGAVQERLRKYAHETSLVCRHYQREQIAEIDALQHPLIVHDAILHAVLPIAVGLSREIHGREG